MKAYLIIFFIALGILFSPTPILTFQYNCSGAESFPVFYAAPFIYKSTSLATSLAYDYYVLGFIGSWLTWALLIGVIWYFFKEFFLSKGNKVISTIYSVVVGIAIFYGVMSIIFAAQTNGGSTVQMNVDLEQMAKDNGMECVKEFRFSTR